ncbi:MAG: tetratricopeptide repeat protein, partial [Acidobacteria bacterium]|nr:tetratricopeptide repeat protein [Acidobacteriota bacterium]
MVRIMRILVALSAFCLFAQSGDDAVSQLLRDARLSAKAGDASGRTRAGVLYRQALALLDGKDAEAVRVFFELGDLASARGELAESKSWFERALVGYKNAGNAAGQAATLNQLGSTLLTLGQIDGATEQYAAARRIWEIAGNRRGVAQTHSNEALAMRHAGQLQRALDSNRRALALARAVPDEALETTILHNTAEVLVDIGQHDEALTAGEAALRLHRRVGPVGGEIHTMIHLAEAWAGKGNIAEARKQLAAAEVRAKKEGTILLRGYILRETARVYAKMGRAKEVAARLEEALALVPLNGFPRMEAEIRLRLGQAARASGRIEYAQRQWTRSLELSRQIENPLLQAEALAALAGVDRDAGRLEQAAGKSDAATVLVESQRSKLAGAAERASYMAVRRELYSIAAGIHVRQGRFEAAFEISERAHARSLLELITQSAAAKPGVAGELQAGLDADATVLEYLVGEDESVVFAVDREKIRAVRLPRRAEIETAVRRAREAMAVPGLRGFLRLVEASTACYRMLIAPVGGLPRNKTRLIVVPDGPLNALPFEALTAASAAAFAELPFVVRTHSVSYAPSLSVYAGLRRGAVEGGPALAALARAEASHGLPALPRVEAEV